MLQSAQPFRNRSAHIFARAAIVWQTIFFINAIPSAIMAVALALTLDKQPMQLDQTRAVPLEHHRPVGDARP
ncbi:hypothetical protein [Rhizobium leguminosarum]|nr:hypothetical protein [Rhizobium leguminosarum]